MIESKNVILHSEKEKDIFFNPMLQGVTPFASSVDSSRLNMAAKYLSQTIPTENADNPLIVTQEVHKIATTDDHFKLVAYEDMFLLYYKHDVMIVYLKESKQLKTLYVPQYINAASASYNLYYVNSKKRIQKGELVYSYAPIDKDSMVPKLGYRVKAIYAPFFGFTTEDSYVISESFSKRARHLHHEKIFIPISKQFKYYKKFENWIPKSGELVTEKEGIIAFQPLEQAKSLFDTLSNISPKESKIFAKKIAPKRDSYVVGEVKVHKFTSDEEKEVSNINESLYNYLEEFHQKQRQAIESELDKSLAQIVPKQNIAEKLKKGIIDTYVFMSKLPKTALTNKFKQFIEDIEIKDIDYIIEIDLASSVKSQLGDKFTSMYAGKGTISVIIPDEIMPKDENGRPYDIIINPISIFGRNNWGIIFEAQFGKIIEDIENIIRADDRKGTIDRLRFVINEYIQHEDSELAEMLKKEVVRLEHDKTYWYVYRKTALDNGLFIYSKAFSNFAYNDIYQFFSKYEREFNVNITKKDKIVFDSKLIKWLQEFGLNSGAFSLPEQDVEIEAFTGINYYMKLYHTAASKYNMANVTGRYTYSGQPVRGRRNQGGTHASWQTLSAFLASGTTNILKELFTVKSDALSEKEKFMADKIRGKYLLKKKYQSKTKTAIDVNLRMLGLKFKDNDD